MADNKPIRDGNDVLFTGAAQELSDGAFAPKVAIMTGDGTPVPMTPARATQLPAALSAGGNLKVAVQETIAAPTTGTASSVAQAITNTAILPNNAARRGATIHNDAAAALKLLLGSAAATATVFTLRMAPDSYYEVPFNYTGPINGLWESAGAGAARCTVLT